MIYDLLIIGGGPAGYLAAERAGHAGFNTLLIEKRFIGGVCLNEGCIPSKALLYSAKLFDGATHGEKYGVKVKEAVLDHKVVTERKNKVVKTLVAGIKGQLKKNNVTVVEAEARIDGKTAEGFKVVAGGNEYISKRILIATGSMPVMPPIPGLKQGLESGFILTNREILDLAEIPQSLVIVGGGVIGLEMASYFNSAGSKVTVIEMLDHIAGNTDGDISGILLKNYQKKGVEFRLSAKVTAFGSDSVSYEMAGQTHAAMASKVLLSIGRRPVTEGIGLDSIGIETEKGRIRTDENGRTNIPGVYAAGDVNGISMLAHTAYREAEVCINHMSGKKDMMSYSSIPSIIYTNPEVGCVGDTEETAKAKGLDIITTSISMRYSGRYIAENEGGDGICKLVLDKKNRRLLGAHAIGNYSSEFIFAAALMIDTQMSTDIIKKLVFPHPTVCEIIREAIFESGI